MRCIAPSISTSMGPMDCGLTDVRVSVNYILLHDWFVDELASVVDHAHQSSNRQKRHAVVFAVVVDRAQAQRLTALAAARMPPTASIRSRVHDVTSQS